MTLETRCATVPGSPLGREDTDELGAAFGGVRANRIARNAVTSDGVVKAARNPVAMRTYTDTYGVSLKAAKTVTNQRQSGRCWLFSTLNVMRAQVMSKLDVDDFELSQAFGMFYDKLEKANSFLEYVTQTAGLPWEDRAVAYLMDNAASDGGEWSFAANLVEKWGAVPKDAMPETACSKNSAQMNDVLARMLRRDAVRLRRLLSQGAGTDEVAGARRSMMQDVHRVLCSCLGEPPRTFDLKVEVGKRAQVDERLLTSVEPKKDPGDDKGGDKPVPGRRILRDRGITPREFVERYADFRIDDYVELISIPGGGREFGRAYGLRWMDTVMGGRPLRFLNVPMERLEDSAVASLRAGEPLYMACDVRQEFGRGLEDFPGVLATDTIDCEGLFDVELDMTRAEMYDSHESALTHAMTFQGVELGDDGRPRAWRVENSWGKDACKDGYLVMSGAWFRTYGGDVVIRRKHVAADLLELWDTAPAQVQDPWGGLGRAVGRIG